MTDEQDWTRIARYLAGECTAAEAEEVRRWFAVAPERQQLADEIRVAWDAAAEPSTTWDTPTSWQRLAARVRAGERRVVLALVRPAAHRQGSRGRRWLAAAIAAAAVVTAAGGLLWRMNTSRSVALATATSLREVRTVPTQRTAFRLPDGSGIVLAPASVLRYDADQFGRGTRDIYLEGRAYFEVAHDVRRPFRVRTTRTVTEDLGTGFMVTDYPGDVTIEVVVTKGTVAVRSPAAGAQPATVLRRDEFLQLDSSGHRRVGRELDAASRVAWTDGRLVFANTPVRDVVAELGRWYGLDIRLGDASLANQRFTASYTTQPDSVVVRELATAIGARVGRHGTVVMLSPMGGRS